jgi:hypothetical protein
MGSTPDRQIAHDESNANLTGTVWLAKLLVTTMG